MRTQANKRSLDRCRSTSTAGHPRGSRRYTRRSVPSARCGPARSSTPRRGRRWLAPAPRSHQRAVRCCSWSMKSYSKNCFRGSAWMRFAFSTHRGPESGNPRRSIGFLCGIDRVHNATLKCMCASAETLCQLCEPEIRVCTGDKENLAWAANAAQPDSAAAILQQYAAARTAEPLTDSGVSGSDKWSGVRHKCMCKRPRIDQTLFRVLPPLVACPRN